MHRVAMIGIRPGGPLAHLVLTGLLLIGLGSHGAAGEDPHLHGVGQLNLALEGGAVEIELIAPGADIVGFEHAPSSDEQRAALAAAAATLAAGEALFDFGEEAGCRLEEASVESALLEDEHHHEASHDEAEDAHAEFHAHYHFDCADAGRLEGLEVRYFEAFPAAEALEARTITPKGQSAQRLTAAKPRLNF